MAQAKKQKRSIYWILPPFVSFIVFSIGFIPLILFSIILIWYAPLKNPWFYVTLPFLVYIGFVIEFVCQVMISGIFIRLFNLRYQPGTYPYTYANKNALKWILVCGLYTPIRKLLEMFLIGRLKNVYYRLLGMKIGKNSLVGGVIKDPCVTEFGRNVTMGEYAIIYGHITNYEKETITIARVRIGDNCVIGAGAILMPGVTMEDSSVLAAGAVVPKNMVLVAGKTYAGVPAKEIVATD